MAKLLIKPSHIQGIGPKQKISPESAGWKYVGFETYHLKKGDILKRPTGSQEICVTLLSGHADISSNNETWKDLGKRKSIFERIPPFAAYLPNDDHLTITAKTDIEIAISLAPGLGNHRARLILPEHMSTETRGEGTNTRYIHNILPETEPADNLLVVEVYTPGGNWSSYPPHKHDSSKIPVESQLEETYYHRLNPNQGFAFQRVYTDDFELDETMAVYDGDVVLVPKGYHPVGAPHGYDLYYLNTMAGPERVWHFANDPKHDWMLNK